MGPSSQLPSRLPMLLVLVGGALGAGLPDLVDPATRTRFPAERPLPGAKAPVLRGVGCGSRAVLRVDEYCLGLYVDLPALRGLAGRERDRAALAKLLCTGKVAVSFPRRFLQGVGRRFRGKALQASLARFWPTPDFDPASPGLSTLLAAVDQDLRRGDWVDFGCDGQGTLIYRVNEGPITRIKDPALCQAFIFNYLGDDGDPAARTLIDALLRNLPALLDAVPAAR